MVDRPAILTGQVTKVQSQRPQVLRSECGSSIWGAAIALAVESVEETTKELEAKGVTVTVPAGESPVCHFACIQDPDGNTIWLHHRKDGSFAD